MDVILYALWVLRAWSKQHSIVGLAQLLTAGFAVLPPNFLLPLLIPPTEFAAKSVARLAAAPTADRIPTVLPGQRCRRHAWGNHHYTKVKCTELIHCGLDQLFAFA
ncbi:hypothetical protein ACQJBY_070173 [Aegilops geniculata]